MKKKGRRWAVLVVLFAILSAGMVSGTRYTVNAKEEQHGELNTENHEQSDLTGEEITEITKEAATDETEERETSESEENSENGGENESEAMESEDGFGTDTDASRITLTPSEPAVDNGIRDVWGYYNQDSEVSVDVLVEEEDGGSGIQKVEYWITDGTEERGADVERRTLYEHIISGDEKIPESSAGGAEVTDEEEIPESSAGGVEVTDEEEMAENSIAGLENGEENADEGCENEEENAGSSEMSTDVEDSGDDGNPEEAAPLLCWTGMIPVDTSVYHTCNVTVYVKTTDCSGNESISFVHLDIDTAAPQISLSFDHNDFVSTDRAGNTYFNKARIATIVITERAEHFDAESAVSGIKVTAKNALGETVDINLNDMVGEWVTQENDSADEAIHTVKITFAEDANYTLSVAYADEAGNVGTVTVADSTVAPYQFTVDMTAPAGGLTAVTAEGETLVWDCLSSGNLSFALKSGQNIAVSGVAEDRISPVVSVSYYKTDNVTALSEQELQALDEEEWKSFSGFTVSADESFAVYERIVDMAGNTTFIGTDGMVVDCTAPQVEELTPVSASSLQQPDNGIYSGDVRVKVRISDYCEETGGSGLQEIRWRVLNMGEETQSGTLYRLEDENLMAADLTQSWEGVFTVDAEKNNSNDVAVEVYATDNIGNTISGQINLKIDVSEPVISVSGVEDGHAYKGDVVPEISFSDINYDSYEMTLTRTDLYEMDADVTEVFLGDMELTETGGSGIYDTFEKIAENDGIYKLSVAVSDLAGNQSRKEVRFSVNRFGSVYVFSDYLVSLIQDGGAFLQSVASDLVITEYNADPLLADSISVEITRDGHPVSDAVYGVTMHAGEDENTEECGWYRYKYTIDKDNFTSEGIYKIVISSEDAAGNLPENTNYENQYILFRVDRTAPEITSITGVEESLLYGQTAEVTYTVYDTIGLKSVQAYVNGEAVGEAVTNFGRDQNNYTGVLTLTAGADSQTIRLVAVDLAGNVTDTADRSAAGIAVFQETVTVTEEDTAGLFHWFQRRTDSESDWSRQSQDGRIFGVKIRWTVGAAAAGACAGIFLFLFRKNRRNFLKKESEKNN